MELLATYGLPSGTVACILLAIYKAIPYKLKYLKNEINDFKETIDNLSNSINDLSKSIEVLAYRKDEK